MKRAILLTGFNNWGKSTHIYDLFGRKVFFKGSTYRIPNVNAEFTVESHSNDDFDEPGFVKAVQNRIADTIKNQPHSGEDTFCALCPSREPHNNAQRILTGAPFNTYNEIHLLLLQYKWDFHAELRIKEIQSYFSSNVSYLVINADASCMTDSQREQARKQQIISYLQGIYP